jgi:predicted nucleotidyltransferase
MYMDKKNLCRDALFSTPLMRVLDFFLQHPDLELSGTEIAAQTKGIRKSAVGLALQRMEKLGLTRRVARGRMVFNSIRDSALIDAMKVASNLAALAPLVERLSPISHRIVLFGSRAAGTHTSESDFDLLIVTSEEDEVYRTIKKDLLAERIQAIVKSPEQTLTLDRDEPALAGQVKEGITLWERE